MGILWNIKSDCFQFRVNLNRTPGTKRGILSVTSSIFDPLGWVAPFSLRAKLVLQQIFREGSDWDEKVSSLALNRWEVWYKAAEALHHLEIQRCFQIGERSENSEVQLHHFADASEKAYGACSYLRVVKNSGQILVNLVMAKSKVAPSANITIPRMELMAAVLATRLSEMLSRELRYTGVRHFFYTDSEIVLGYLRNEAKRFKIFVANRVQQIHDASEVDQWRHVSGCDNLADLASRGMGAADLVDSKLWFHGPQFLKQRDFGIKNTKPVSIDPEDIELRRITCNTIKSSNQYLDTFNFSLFSSWKSLTRGVARAKKLAVWFKSRLSIKSRLRSHSKDTTQSTLSVSDFQFAEQLIIKAIQHSFYAQEISQIRADEAIVKGSNLYKLNCMLDSSGVLRVGGRLKYTNLHSAYKHPVILPKGAHVSLLLIRDCHQSVHHQGRGMTINEVRARGYWVISLNGLVKEMIRNCVTCRALRGSTVTQKMADLPPDRADCMPPFHVLWDGPVWPLFSQRTAIQGQEVRSYIHVPHHQSHPHRDGIFAHIRLFYTGIKESHRD